MENQNQINRKIKGLRTRILNLAVSNLNNIDSYRKLLQDSGLELLNDEISKNRDEAYSVVLAAAIECNMPCNEDEVIHQSQEEASAFDEELDKKVEKTLARLKISNDPESLDGSDSPRKTSNQEDLLERGKEILYGSIKLYKSIKSYKEFLFKNTLPCETAISQTLQEVTMIVYGSVAEQLKRERCTNEPNNDDIIEYMELLGIPDRIQA